MIERLLSYIRDNKLNMEFITQNVRITRTNLYKFNIENDNLEFNANCAMLSIDLNKVKKIFFDNPEIEMKNDSDFKKFVNNIETDKPTSVYLCDKKNNKLLSLYEITDRIIDY